MTFIDFVLDILPWLLAAFFFGRIIEGRSCDRWYGELISELETELEKSRS